MTTIGWQLAGGDDGQRAVSLAADTCGAKISKSKKSKLENSWPIRGSARARSREPVQAPAPSRLGLIALDGCNRLGFEPSIKARRMEAGSEYADVV